MHAAFHRLDRKTRRRHQIAENERSRRYRQRRRVGHVRIAAVIDADDIATLIRAGLLAADHDRAAVAAAILYLSKIGFRSLKAGASGSGVRPSEGLAAADSVA